MQFSLSLVSIKFKHFLIFGCGKVACGYNIIIIKNFFLTGCPVINMAIWILLRILLYDPSNSNDFIRNCPFFETNGVDFFVCEVPIIFILICNTFFLIWTMVVSKSMISYDKRHWKAAKVKNYSFSKCLVVFDFLKYF